MEKLWKMCENIKILNLSHVRKYKIIKLVTTERKRNYLISELNDHTTKFFITNLLAIEMKKI